MKLTKVTDRFHEHDLRVKVASDSATVEEASERLSSSKEIIERVYRRRPVKMQLLQRKKME